MSTALSRLYGSEQGRITPAFLSKIAGDFVFVLGSDRPGVVQRFVQDDQIILEQTADITGVKLVRFRAQIRAPSSIPSVGISTTGGAGLFPEISVAPSWTFSWGVGTDVHGSRLLEVGKTYVMNDGAIDVSQLTGNQALRFTLKVAA